MVDPPPKENYRDGAYALLVIINIPTTLNFSSNNSNNNSNNNNNNNNNKK